MPGSSRGPDTCPRSAAPATLDRARLINRPVLIRGTPLTGARRHPNPIAVATVNYKARVAAPAMFETVNYTKGLMLFRVPGMLTLCFMASTVKTRSVLKLSRSSLPSLHFYLSSSFGGGGGGGKGAEQLAEFPSAAAQRIPHKSARYHCLLKWLRRLGSVFGRREAAERRAGSLAVAFKTATNHPDHHPTPLHQHLETEG